MRLLATRRRKRGTTLAGLAVAAVSAVGVLASTTLAGAATPGPVFRPAGSYDVGSTPVDSAAADLDGDGDRDLAVANEDSQYLSVLLNQGDGTFAKARRIRARQPQDEKGPNDVVAADFNEDGVPDLATVTALFSKQISILIGNGDGSFQPPYIFENAVGPGVGLTAGDFNGDGHVDLVIAQSFDGKLRTLLGNGDGTFQVTSGAYDDPYTRILNGRPAEVMSADFNGDGVLDVAILGAGRGGDRLTPLLGDGDGTFSAAFREPYKSNPEWTRTGSYNLDLCYAPDFNHASKDFNGDGVPDLAVVNSCPGGKTTIFLGNGDGTFTRGESYPTEAEPTSLAVGDFDGDGTNDLALTKRRRTGKVSVLAGAGDGTFEALTRPPSYRVGSNPLGVTAADFNGDGRPDLAVPSFSDVGEPGTFTVLLNTGGRPDPQG